ncbi:MAG: FAD binding domain-containing protein [Nitrososphaerota archaeon]
MLLFGHLSLPRFSVSRPSSLREAVERVSSGEGVYPIAGGTALIPLIKMGLLEVRELVDLSSVKELGGIRRENGSAFVGGMVTHTELVDAAPWGMREVLSDFSRNHTSPHVMNLATVGGSVASSTSSEDLLPVLLAADAEVVLAGLDGGHSVSLEDYLARRDSFKAEIVEGVRVRTSWDGWRFSFSKLSVSVLRMPAYCVVVGARISNRTVEDCRVAVAFADGLRPARLRDVEEVVKGKRVDGIKAAEVEEVVRGSIRPAGDVHFPSEYRRKVTSRVTALMLSEVIGA